MTVMRVRKHEEVPQPREAPDDFSEQQRSPIAVLDVGGVDQGMDEVALGIGEDVPLAALDLLACITTPRTAAFGGFDALAVDDTGAGRSLAPLRFPPYHEQILVEREPQAIVAPQVEPAPHRRDRWKHGGSIGHLRGRPTNEGGGKNGSSTTHSASVKSLGKASPARAYSARVVSVHIVEILWFVAKPQNQRSAQPSS